MPGTDGFAFAQALRENPRYSAIPVIALSSHATPALLDQIHDAGFASFVPKFDRPGLIAAIRSVATNLHKAA
jgi:two-component system, chemotaxis family, sensor kinase CheA